MGSPMNFPSRLIVIALATFALSPCHAETTPDLRPRHERYGEEKPIRRLGLIEVRNLQNVRLGRIKDIGLDLPNGRIVEVFVVSGEFLGFGGRIVAVPPAALTSNAAGDIYRLDVGVAAFAAMPDVSFSHWNAVGREERIAAAYRRFGQTPFFLVNDEAADPNPERAKVELGFIYRADKFLGLPIENLRNEPLGKIDFIGLDIPAGVVRKVVVVSNTNLRTRSVIPARSLRFNAARDRLLFDDSSMPFADQPRLVLTPSAFGNPAHSVEENYRGPRTWIPLEQGTGRRDRNRTALIRKNLQAAKIAGLECEVGTLNSRTTLRGRAESEAARNRAGAIAIAASRVELVDNQITFDASSSAPGRMQNSDTGTTPPTSQ